MYASAIERMYCIFDLLQDSVKMTSTLALNGTAVQTAIKFCTLALLCAEVPLPLIIPCFNQL